MTVNGIKGLRVSQKTSDPAEMESLIWFRSLTETLHAIDYLWKENFIQNEKNAFIILRLSSKRMKRVNFLPFVLHYRVVTLRGIQSNRRWS